MKIPLLMRAPVGVTGRGAQHAQNLEPYFLSCPGLKIVAPATAYDAAHVLHRVVQPAYVWPTLGGALLKPGGAEPRRLYVTRSGSGWAITASNAVGIASGTVSLSLPNDVPVAVSGAKLLASRQDGPVLHVAFVRDVADPGVLFEIAPVDGAPLLSEAVLNEGLISVAGLGRPLEFALDQNTPNPFNPTTTIRFGLADAGRATLSLYDVNGRHVRTLVAGELDAGYHDIVWNGLDARGRQVASGVYLYRLTSRSRTLVRKALLVR